MLEFKSLRSPSKCKITCSHLPLRRNHSRCRLNQHRLTISTSIPYLSMMRQTHNMVANLRKQFNKLSTLVTHGIIACQTQTMIQLILALIQHSSFMMKQRNIYLSRLNQQPVWTRVITVSRYLRMVQMINHRRWYRRSVQRLLEGMTLRMMR